PRDLRRYREQVGGAGEIEPDRDRVVFERALIALDRVDPFQRAVAMCRPFHRDHRDELRQREVMPRRQPARFIAIAYDLHAASSAYGSNVNHWNHHSPMTDSSCSVHCATAMPMSSSRLRPRRTTSIG